MADELVEHRFVQIYQACERASSKLDDFWNTLAQTSAIAVSHGCEKVYARVTQSNKDLDLLQTVQSLQNLMLTNDDSTKSAILLRTITRLLIFNQEHATDKAKIQFHHCKTDSQQVHPYATLMRQKPTLYFDLLEEVDYVISNHASVAISMSHGFISAIFLTENAVDPNAFLIRLTSAIMTNGIHSNNSMMTDIYACTSNILFQYPLQKESGRYLSLVDFLMWITIINKPYQKLQADRATVSTTDYIYPFMDRLITASSKKYPIMSYLARLERMIADCSNDVLSDVIWVCLAYILFGSQNVTEQQAIMRLIKSMRAKVSSNVSRIAYLPLYQLLSELNDKDASTDLKTLKDDTLNMLYQLDNIKNTASFDQTSKQHMQTLTQANTIYGLLAHLLVYLDGFYNDSIPVLIQSYNAGPDTTLTLNMLFSTPHAYDADLDTQCIVLSRITELSSLVETSCKFPMLLFLLRMLCASFDEPRLVAHLFKDVIPMLADPSDPTLTSKVLQLILSSISSGDTMASLGVKALAHTHQRQPRVWQELKKVFAEWVLRRKSGTVRRKVDLSVSGPIKLELAVLTTMRDVCKTKPRECAPDVLPMVMSLLQTCQDLSMASLSILMTTINHCITAGLVEPRSIWNITVVYLAQFAVDQGTQKSALLVQELCTFYSIAGSRNDTSEPYLQFKEHLLTEFVLPLIDSNDQHAAQHAMLALSKFSAQDMAIVLPEKAAEYVQHATPTDDHPIENQHLVLATLMSNELDHMRRGLFKEENSKKQVTSSTSSKQHITNDAGHVVGEHEIEIQALLSQLWEDARVAPGLRSGYAIAMLYTLNSRDAPTKTLQDMSKTKWYRFMVTSFTDVSLTDHLLLRVSSIGSWKSFFQNALSDTKNELEAMASILVKDLLARLERSTVPGVTCNIAMAITGLVLVIQLYTPSYAASCANEIIDILMKNYIVLSGSPLSHSAHLMSEEVQFAARFALGHLATCIISNEKVVQEIYKVLLDAATSSTNSKYRNIDTSVDLIQFANGYAAGHFVASLTVYPTMTDSIGNLKTAGLASLQQYYTLDDASDSRVVGILMGLASKLKPALMCDADTVGDELNVASTKLKEYLNGGSICKGLLLGSTWVVALGALQEYGVEYDYSNIIESVMAAASRDPNLAQHFYHFVVPYTQILYHGYVHADADDETAVSQYTQAFEPLFDSIQSDDASSNYRIASLFGIATLLGVDYLNRNATSDLYAEAQRYQASSRQAGLDKLAAITGLTVKSAPTGNLKSGRIAAAACGKVLAHTHLLMQALDSDQSTTGVSSTAADTMAALASASSEPINYNRLNSNTSYLRAVFDKLAQLASSSISSNKHNITMLLKSFVKTPGPLPPVNWFALLLKLSKSSPDMQQLCFLFASTHAATSFSLSEYLATQTMALLKEGNSTKSKCLFASNGGLVENAFGTLLMLGGLPRVKGVSKEEEKRRRGMNAVTKKMSISESRILELVKQLAERFQSFDQDMQYAALSTLADHLPSSEEQLDESKSKLVSSLYTLIFESVISQILCNKSTTEKVLRQAVSCTRTESINQLLPTGRLEDWDHVSPTVNYLVYLCESYHLSKKKQTTIKYISTAITHLIGNGATESENCWRVVADMIANNCRTDQDALGWIIRVLDAFVVYISSFHAAEQPDQDVLMKAIHTGFHAILIELRSSPENVSDVPLQIADTAYLLGYFIGIASEHKTEQEQIVKRIFKLLGMVRHLQSADCTDFFKSVVLGMPSVYLLQYQM
ncbi:Transcription factor [Mucor velutinosus]|uniref:Transcription factor n=1 Tax=Mucor velutinosus TaxID=708070 RepID=A0AAN7DHS1_9FUNG|nr:Transcription factor [Mucor velutinosus]